MSGIKRVSLEEEQRARAEALRKAAEERMARERAAARESLLAECAAATSLYARHSLSGLSEALSFVRLEEQRARKLADSTQGTAASFLASAEAMRKLTARAAQSAAFLQTLPAGRVKEGFLRALQGSKSGEDLDKVVAAWREQESAFASIDKLLQGIEETSRFLRACEAARLLSREQLLASGNLEQFLGTPDPGLVAEFSQKARALESPALRAQLRERERQALACLHQLEAPKWQERLAEWRSGFPSELKAAGRVLAAGNFLAAKELLRELDDFFLARAHHRIELIREAAIRTGRKCPQPKFLPDYNAFVLEIHDGEGLFAQAVEVAQTWQGASLDDELTIEGPSNHDAEACMGAGVSSIASQLHAGGSAVQICSEEGRELIGDRQAPVPTAPVPVGPRTRRLLSES